MKRGFTNVETFSNGALFAEEIAVLQEILWKILNRFRYCPKYGTIILEGQQKGEDEKHIMRMNLEKGGFQKRFKHGCGWSGPDWTSEKLAEESIREIRGWPGNKFYDSNSYFRFFGELPTCIYKREPLMVTVSNTTFGRFLMSVHLSEDDREFDVSPSFEYYSTSCCLMKCMAMVLAKMRPKDIVLQRSVKSLMHDVDDLEQWMGNAVDCEFETCDLPGLTKWKKWYGETEADGSLDFYFQ